MDEPTTNVFGQTLPNTSDSSTLKAQKVDHLAEIAALATGLHNVSPSGAETISAQIQEHVAALQDPKAK